MVDEATRRARMQAHAAFDMLWREGLCTRRDAYRELASELGVKDGQAHMSEMSAEQALRVPDAAAAIYLRLLDAAENSPDGR